MDKLKTEIEALDAHRCHSCGQDLHDDKQDELMQKEQNLISYRNNLMQELSTDESKLLNDVYEQVQEYMKEYAKENGIDLILSHTRGGAIWYATDAIDVTKAVTEGLNKKYNANPAAAETKTASGIIIPDNAKEKPQKGKVVAVGSGTKDEKMTVNVGDTVLYGKYAGTELKLDGQDYLIMRESDILAIV